MTLLIFDCDGVLVDSELLAVSSLAAMLAELGKPVPVDEAMRLFAGRNLTDILARIERLVGRAPARGGDRRRLRARLLDRFRRELRPVPGVSQAIAALPYPRCIASSSPPERLRISLEVTGLAPLFGDHVFSADQVARGKPAPDLFLFAARSMGMVASDCIVIEDMPRGIAAARAAGMRTIGFAGASHARYGLADRLAEAKADVVIRAMKDLPAAVGQLARRLDRGA